MKVLWCEKSDLRLIIIPKADVQTLLLVCFVIYTAMELHTIMIAHVVNDTAANYYNCFNGEAAAAVVNS